MTVAVGYVRVSTAGQAEDGVSLEHQEAKVRAYAEAHDLELAEVYRDDGISGKRTDNRPGLQDAVKHACRDKGVLVALSLTRLARNTRDCIDLTERINACGADLALINEKIDTTGAMGRFVFRLMASLGELERDQVSERTKAALGHKRKKGERISRYAPIGYRFQRDRLVKDPEGQRAITRAKELRAEGLSFGAIGDALLKEGTRPPRAERWSAKVIRSLVQRD